MKTKDQVDQVAGCNVSGRLEFIRSLVFDVAAMGSTWQKKDSAILEIDKLLGFVNPVEERTTPK